MSAEPLSPEAEHLLERARLLNDRERELVAFLLLHPEEEKEPGYDEAWEAEIERRLRDLDEGRVRPIPFDDVMAKLRERFG